MNKAFWMSMFLIVIFLIVIVVAFGFVGYSTITATSFCKEREMKYFDIIQEETWDLKDDVICWAKTGAFKNYDVLIEDKDAEVIHITTQVTSKGEEIKFYYFKR